MPSPAATETLMPVFPDRAASAEGDIAITQSVVGDPVSPAAKLNPYPAYACTPVCLHAWAPGRGLSRATKVARAHARCRCRPDAPAAPDAARCRCARRTA